MNKIKNLFKGSTIAMVMAGILVAGVISAAVLTTYGHTTGTAEVQQSVLFGNGTTEKTYTVGNSKPVAGNVYYDLVTLMNNASDKPATVVLNTSYLSSEHSSWWSGEETGITTSYLNWTTPQVALTGVRPTAIYNSTGDKRYEVWYKTTEGSSNIHYASSYYDGGWKWSGANTNVSGSLDAPFVMKENGKYYMVNYGSTSEKEFYIYTSDNGINWTTGKVIYTEGRDDLAKVDNPKILKDETGYKMYFQGKTTESHDPKYYIFLATSDAKNMQEIAVGGKTFSAANGGNSVLQPGADGEWDSFRIMHPMVFKSGNQGYTMLYTGYSKDDQRGKIGYAVSTDGIAWDKVKVSDEGFDKTLGIDTDKTSVVKTNDNLVLFYQKGSNINWTWLTSVVDTNSQMTLQPNEIKPFFIENDFAINLKPMTYKIKTDVNPVTE